MALNKDIKNFFDYLQICYGKTFFWPSLSLDNETTSTKDKKSAKENPNLATSLIQFEIFYFQQNWTNATNLFELEMKTNKCQNCPLGRTRTKFVFGYGNPKADIMLIGEAPGADEDLQGLPFVGRAGQLLTKILKSFNLRREDVYICNILKCRPPNNRKPYPSEIKSCLPYLHKQIELISPKIILALGTTAVEGLLGITAKIAEIHGKVMEFNGIKVIPTYHPAALLRNPNLKQIVKNDIHILLKTYKS